jgi:hypothetical protein
LKPAERRDSVCTMTVHRRATHQSSPTWRSSHLASPAARLFAFPALVAAGDGVLLAFAECRKWTCNDYGQHDLMMWRSTKSGSTFGELITWARRRLCACRGSASFRHQAAVLRCSCMVLFHRRDQTQSLPRGLAEPVVAKCLHGFRRRSETHSRAYSDVGFHV